MLTTAKYLAAFICLSVMLPAFAADGDKLEAHPFIGKWQWTRAENNCTEVYEFRADGAGFVQSGDERSDVTFNISDKPDGQGFYALKLKTVVDYGGKDCTDSESNDTGQESTTYIIFDPARQQHLSCAQPNLSACFGPLNRIRE
jgi:hypothetical protein